MTLDIWKECDGMNHVKQLSKTAWRIIESQEKISLRKLVDSVEEQKILEETIDRSRPVRLQSPADFHPFLSGPFRYPPLKNGSRFGKKTEPSLWYGGLTPRTAMAEKAYYQQAFFQGMIADAEPVFLPMVVFSVQLNLPRGIELDKPPFLKYKDQVSSPVVYETAQYLGQQMRGNNIDGFTFVSARDREQGVNIGVFKIDSFASRYPDADSFQIWQCNATRTNVEFVRLGCIQEDSLAFSAQDFIIDGVFPCPCVD